MRKKKWFKIKAATNIHILMSYIETLLIEKIQNLVQVKIKCIKQKKVQGHNSIAFQKLIRDNLLDQTLEA